MKRAIRRHHRSRLKRKRRYHWGRDLINEPKILAVAVNTPTPCSCWICCNIRRNKWLPEKERLTRQELKFLLKEKDYEV